MDTVELFLVNIVVAFNTSCVPVDQTSKQLEIQGSYSLVIVEVLVNPSMLEAEIVML